MAASLVCHMGSGWELTPVSFCCSNRFAGERVTCYLDTMVNTHCRQLLARRLCEGKALPVGGEALNTFYEESDPLLCFCTDCRKLGYIRKSHVVSIEIVIDVQTCRPACHALVPTTIQLEHDPHPPLVSDLMYRACAGMSYC